jgi:hypothetical protein
MRLPRFTRSQLIATVLATLALLANAAAALADGSGPPYPK